MIYPKIYKEYISFWLVFNVKYSLNTWKIIYKQEEIFFIMFSWNECYIYIEIDINFN